MKRNFYLDTYRKATSKVAEFFLHSRNIELLANEFGQLYVTMGAMLSDLQHIISNVFVSASVLEEPEVVFAKPGPRKSQPLPKELELLAQNVSAFGQQSKRVRPKSGTEPSPQAEQKPEVHETIGFSGMIEAQPAEIVRKSRQSNVKQVSQNSRKSTNLSAYLQRNSPEEKNFFDQLQSKRPLYKL